MNERWLVTGASGQLGGHAVTQLQKRDKAEILGWTRQNPAPADIATRSVDLADPDAIRNAVTEFQPTHVLHLGAITAVADAYANPSRARQINVEGSRVLAESVAKIGGRFVYCSSDMVFDGEHAPYRENDEAKPLSVYGQSKLEAERAVLAFENTLVVRVPLMFGFAVVPRATTFSKQIEALKEGECLRLFADEFRTPIWLGDAARALIGLATDDITGILHVAGPKRLSRYDLIKAFAGLLGMTAPNLAQISSKQIDTPEPRPRDLSLDSSRLASLRPDLSPGEIRREVFEAAQ